ncbi:hypothetical protein Plhal304r1_c047g0129181 [Plasmopara halstedii]
MMSHRQGVAQGVCVKYIISCTVCWQGLLKHGGLNSDNALSKLLVLTLLTSQHVLVPHVEKVREKHLNLHDSLWQAYISQHPLRSLKLAIPRRLYFKYGPNLYLYQQAYEDV